MINLSILTHISWDMCFIPYPFKREIFRIPRLPGIGWRGSNGFYYVSQYSLDCRHAPQLMLSVIDKVHMRALAMEAERLALNSDDFCPSVESCDPFGSIAYIDTFIVLPPTYAARSIGLKRIKDTKVVTFQRSLGAFHGCAGIRKPRAYCSSLRDRWRIPEIKKDHTYIGRYTGLLSMNLM